MRLLTGLWIASFLGLASCGPPPSAVPAGAGGASFENQADRAAAETGSGGEVSALFVRTVAGAPVACAELLRADDQDGWWACRESQAADAGQQSVVVPVGCFDRRVGDWSGECDFGDALVSGSGQPVSLRESVPVVCDASGDWLEGHLSTFSADDTSGLAGLDAPIDVPPPDGSLPSEQQREMVLTSARELLAEHNRDKDVRVRQVVRADLDSDGEDDWLVSVESSSGDLPDRALGALFLGRGAEPASFVLLMESEIEAFDVLALTDLDRDGSRELLIRTSYYEGEYTFLYRFAGDDLVLLGGWGCGA